MSNWLAGRLDTRRRFICSRGFPAEGRFFGQVVTFALQGYETLDQQFTPRGIFTIWGTTAVSLSGGSFAVEIRISGKKGKRYNRSVVSNNLAGTAQRPFFLPDLLVCQPTEDVVITCTDLSGVANNVAFLILGALNG